MQFADLHSLALIRSASSVNPISPGCHSKTTSAVAISRTVFGSHLRKCSLLFSIHAIHSRTADRIRRCVYRVSKPVGG